MIITHALFALDLHASKIFLFIDIVHHIV